jgi:hypothetical protein
MVFLVDVKFPITRTIYQALDATWALETNAPARNREEEAAKARARGMERFAAEWCGRSLAN